MRRVGFACAVASVLSAPLAAQTTIGTGSPSDHVGPVGKDSDFGPIPTAIAQTFLAPTGTNYLQSFTLYITNFINGGALKLDASVYVFAGDHVTGSALYSSGQFNGTDSDTDQALTFGSGMPINILLSPGTTYAFVLSSVAGYASTPDGSTVLAGASSIDTYANGALFVSTVTTAAGLSSAGAFTAADAPPDAAFSATFTEAAETAAPEPAGIVLLASGLLMIGAFSVTRRCRASR